MRQLAKIKFITFARKLVNSCHGVVYIKLRNISANADRPCDAALCKN